MDGVYKIPACFSGCVSQPIGSRRGGCDAAGIGSLVSPCLSFGVPGSILAPEEQLLKEHRVEKLVFPFGEEKSKSSVLV